LMHQKGHYYRLYTQQFRQELESQLDPFTELQEGTASAS